MEDLLQCTLYLFRVEMLAMYNTYLSIFQPLSITKNKMNSEMSVIQVIERFWHRDIRRRHYSQTGFGKVQK